MMLKRILKTLVVMAVLLSLAAVPALAETENGPIVATSVGSIVTLDPATGETSYLASGYQPTLTPDGKTVVYVGDTAGGDSSGNLALFSVPIDGSADPTQLTPTERNISRIEYPAVSPDGQTVYFVWQHYSSNGRYHLGLYSVPIGGGKPTVVVEDDVYRQGMKITPDGQYLVYIADSGYKVEATPVNGGPTHTVVDNSQIDNFGSLTISPDGQTVVMSGGETWSGTGSTSLYAAPFSATTTNEATIIPGTTVTPFSDPDTGEQNLLASPAFSPDGHSIAYTLVRYNPNDANYSYELRSVSATGGTPSVIVPMGQTYYLDLVWAPQAVPSVVPAVVEPTDPVNGATEVDKTIQPKATFNTDLDASTVNAQNVRLEVYNSTKQKWVLVSSTPSYDQDTKTITVTPAKSLGSQKEYRVSLSTGIKSSTGGTLASPYSWTFITKK